MSDHLRVMLALPRPRTYINAHINGRGALAVGLVFALIGAFVAVARWDDAQNPSEFAYLLLFAATGIFVGTAGAITSKRDVAWSTLRVRRKGPLRFCRSRLNTGLEGALTLVCASWGFAMWLAYLGPNPAFHTLTERGGAGLFLLGSLGFLYSLFVLVSSAGLEVNARGVQKRTSVVWRTVRWEELEVVRVVPGRKPLRLGVGGASGAFTVNSRAIGSDPNYVAMIIEYYRDHPGERYRLDDGIAAVRHVEEALAPLRRDSPGRERD